MEIKFACCVVWNSSKVYTHNIVAYFRDADVEKEERKKNWIQTVLNSIGGEKKTRKNWNRTYFERLSLKPISGI